MTQPNTHAAANPLSPYWPSEAGEIVGHIQVATGTPPGSRLAGSIATPVGDTDLKTQLRRLYSALGGKRTGQPSYDPTADELRALYAGTVTAASLMAKAVHGSEAGQRAAEQTVTREAEAAPVAAPVVKPAKPAPAGADAIAQALAAFMASQTPAIDEAAVRAIVDDAAGAKLQEALATVEQAIGAIEPKLQQMIEAATRRVEITVNDAPAVTIDVAHKALPDLLKVCTAGVSPFLVGPAGSGKTTLAKQIADALGRPFYMASRVSSEYKLTGFIDATGKAVQTDFRRAYEKGGVFLFDEADASDADAFVALNAALANNWADFPDGKVERHEGFVAIAAGNTYGRGANRDYVGRQQLDAATLDRFAIFAVDYDEELERTVAGNDDWTSYVQKVRRAVEREKVRAIVSPRASIFGAKLLAAGLDREAVAEAVIFKGMAETERSRITAAVSYL